MSRTVGIVAGNGTLPIEIARTLRGNDIRPFIVGIADEADDAIGAYDHRRLEWGRLGNLFRLLEGEGARRVIFAGGVHQRPTMRPDRLDLTTIKVLPTLLKLLLSGDDTILSGLIRMFEERGFELVGIADIAPDLLLSEPAARPSPRVADQIELGTKIVRALGPFDVGQAVVVCGRRAVAVEGLEGTDGLLERVERMRDMGRLRDQREGVLVKVPKPQQDRRVDLPSIGPRTIINARAAGLTAIAGELGGLVILERDRTVALAREHGVALHAVAP